MCLCIYTVMIANAQLDNNVISNQFLGASGRIL